MEEKFTVYFRQHSEMTL